MSSPDLDAILLRLPPHPLFYASSATPKKRGGWNGSRLMRRLMRDKRETSFWWVLFQGIRRSGWVKTFPRSSLKDPTRVMPIASATCMASEVAADTPVRISALSLAVFITIS